jgi:SWI/SNF-related matrix-associated actin-dependent regulator of chromatin subfamily A protein 2/4
MENGAEGARAEAHRDQAPDETENECHDRLARCLELYRRARAADARSDQPAQLDATLEALVSVPSASDASDSPLSPAKDQVIAQASALRLLCADCDVPDSLLARASNGSSQCSHAPVFSAAELRTIRQQRAECSVQRMTERMESSKREERLPHHVRKRAAIDARSARLHQLQSLVRNDLAQQLRCREECTPDQLLDWSGARREDAGELQLMHIAAYEKSRSQQNANIYRALLSRYESISKFTSDVRRYGYAAAVQRAQEAAAFAAANPATSGGSNASAGGTASGKNASPAAIVKQRVVSTRKQFLHEVTQHGHEFRKRSFNSVKQRKTLTDGANTFHQKKRTQMAREQRERLAALKAEDEESYFQLVRDAKDQRVKTVLQKTDDLLQQLGTKIKEQKRAAAASGDVDTVFEDGSSQQQHATANGDKENQQHDDGSGTGRNDFREGRRMYEATIKEVQEDVKKQSALLRGPDSSSGELRQYQMAGLDWMVSLYNNNLNGILADEMGLGKTIQTIALLAHLMERKGNNGPHLIVAPKAVLENWRKEFNDWVDQSIMDVVVYDGKAEERKELRDKKLTPRSFNVCVTHYDLVMRDKSTLSKIEWQYLIVDEGHRLKNHKSKLSELLNRQFKSRFRLLLTGTPIQNNLKELWSLLNFLLPKIFNSSESFKDWFNKPFQGAKQEDIDLTEEEELLLIGRLHQVIRPFLLRRKKDEVEQELPNKVEVKLKCEMSAWQKAFYRQIVDHASVGLGKGMGKSRGLQNTAMQLRKACNHPYLFIQSSEYKAQVPEELVRASGKFELLDRVLPKLKAGGHRLLLFSQMTKCMDVLEDFLVDCGYRYVRLDGDTKTTERTELLNEFNAEGSDVFVFLLSTRAGGLGLNLQGADTVIMFESDWNPQIDQQAEDRAHRIGQRKEVQVIVFVTVNSIEEKIIEAAKQKRGIDQKVIQAGLFNNQATAQQRTEVLKDVFKKGSAQLEDERTDVPDDEEINRIIARDQDEFELYQKLDNDRKRAGGVGTTASTNNEDEEDNGDDGMATRSSRLLTEAELPDWVLQSGADDGDAAEAAGEGPGADGNEPSESRQRFKRGLSFAEPDEELRDILGPMPDEMDMDADDENEQPTSKQEQRQDRNKGEDDKMGEREGVERERKRGQSQDEEVEGEHANKRRRTRRNGEGR